MNLKLQENEQLSITAANGLAGVFVNGTSLSASLNANLSSKADSSSLTAYEQTSSLYNDVSSIVLENDDSLYLSSEYGSLNNISTGDDMTFSGEIAGLEFRFYQTGAVDWGWSWLIDSGDVSNFDINVDTSVTIDIAGANLAAQLGTDSITFYKVEQSKNKLGLVTDDYLTDRLSVILSKYKTYDATVSSLSDDGYALYSQVSSKAEVSALNAKITIDDRISGIFNQTDLSIIKLSATEYNQLLQNNNVMSNAMYVVENNIVDAYGQQIKNVAAPTDLSDAATKGYVDNAVSSIDLSEYYEKTETSSASEISNALASKANRSELAPEFNAASSYAVGAMVTYGDATYECISAHSGTWNANHFNDSTMYDYVSNIEEALDAINGNGVAPMDYGYLFINTAPSNINGTQTIVLRNYCCQTYECNPQDANYISSFTVAPPSGITNRARDMVLVLDCSNMLSSDDVPAVTWTNAFHPRNDINADMIPQLGSKNMFYITEYSSGSFVVGKWIETSGGYVP